MTISAKPLYNSALMPQKSEDGLTYQLFACLYDDDDGFVDIEPHSALKVSTGVALDIPQGYAGLVLAAGQGFDIEGGIALVTPQNADEVTVMLHNDGEYVATVNNGQPIAKLLVIPTANADII